MVRIYILGFASFFLFKLLLIGSNLSDLDLDLDSSREKFLEFKKTSSTKLSDLGESLSESLTTYSSRYRCLPKKIKRLMPEYINDRFIEIFLEIKKENL